MLKQHWDTVTLQCIPIKTTTAVSSSSGCITSAEYLPHSQPPYSFEQAMSPPPAGNTNLPLPAPFDAVGWVTDTSRQARSAHRRLEVTCPVGQGDDGKEGYVTTLIRIGTGTVGWSAVSCNFSPDGLHLAVAVSHEQPGVQLVEFATGAVSSLAGAGYFRCAVDNHFWPGGHGGHDGSNDSNLIIDGTGSSAFFCSPTSATYSPDGLHIVVADMGNKRIREVDTRTGAVSTLAGNGACASFSSSGFCIPSGTDGVGAGASFCSPSFACYSPDGLHIAVVDGSWGSSGNGKLIRMVEVSTRAVSTLAGNLNSACVRMLLP